MNEQILDELEESYQTQERMRAEAIAMRARISELETVMRAIYDIADQSVQSQLGSYYGGDRSDAKEHRTELDALLVRFSYLHIQTR